MRKRLWRLKQKGHIAEHVALPDATESLDIPLQKFPRFIGRAAHSKIACPAVMIGGSHDLFTSTPMACAFFETIDSADAPALHAFDEVRALRAAIIAAGSAIAAGAAPDGSATAMVARLAARSLAAASLHGIPATIAFTPEDQILGPLAWAALDLLRGDELARVKQCPPDDCRWLFIDRTKNGSRRWCDMASCGNRAKARRSRE